MHVGQGVGQNLRFSCGHHKSMTPYHVTSGVSLLMSKRKFFKVLCLAFLSLTSETYSAYEDYSKFLKERQFSFRLSHLTSSSFQHILPKTSVLKYFML